MGVTHCGQCSSCGCIGGKSQAWVCDKFLWSGARRLGPVLGGSPSLRGQKPLNPECRGDIDKFGVAGIVMHADQLADQLASLHSKSAPPRPVRSVAIVKVELPTHPPNCHGTWLECPEGGTWVRGVARAVTTSSLCARRGLQCAGVECGRGAGQGVADACGSVAKGETLGSQRRLDVALGSRQPQDDGLERQADLAGQLSRQAPKLLEQWNTSVHSAINVSVPHM